MDARVASRYAKALFSAALKEKVLDAVEDDLNQLGTTLAKNARFRNALLNPEFSRDDKAALLINVYASSMTPLTLKMLRLMLQKRREPEIEAMHQAYVRLRRRHERVLGVVIHSAKPLTDEHRKAMVTKLQTATGRRVEASFAVEPSLIGGMKVTSNNYVLDGTVVGSLDRMREQLLYDLLKQNA